MDLSSLTEDQRQQMQQIQEKYLEHRARQQEEADAAALQLNYQNYLNYQQPYDPSQVQPYDPSHVQPYDPSQIPLYNHSSYYAYYYQHPNQSQNSQLHHHHHQQQPYSGYYQANYTDAVNSVSRELGNDKERLRRDAGGSLGGSMVEREMAMLEPRQWQGMGGGYGPSIGSMHHGPRTIYPQVGRPPYRGGGRRGGGPFRGNGSHRNSGNHRPNSESFGPPPSLKGRSHPKANSNSTMKPANAPNPQPFRCELCEVECTSLEILEQHKNGKKHQKKLQKSAESKLNDDKQVEADNDQNLPENAKTDTSTSENKLEGEQNSAQIQGLKRKVTGGSRGGKRVKTTRPTGIGPTKPKVVIPLICDLCNVKCDTQEVFDRHVAGKKHISKLKRFEGHQAMFGPTGLLALYPPNPIAQALLRPEGPPQEAQPGPPQEAQPGPQTSNPPPAAATQAQNPNPQISDAPLQFSR